MISLDTAMIIFVLFDIAFMFIAIGLVVSIYMSTKKNTSIIKLKIFLVKLIVILAVSSPFVTMFLQHIGVIV